MALSEEKNLEGKTLKSKRRVVDWRALKRTPVEMLEKRFIWRGRRKNNGPTVDKEAHLFPRSFIFKTRVARARCTRTLHDAAR